jgi:hypothetical protein
MDKATKDQEEKALRFTKFCVRRLRTELTENQIAADLGFRSPTVLYSQLALDGSPVCRVCGRLYPEPDHRKEHKQKRRTRQPGVGGGQRKKLPDASDARYLFRQSLESLNEFIAFVDIEESWLEGNLEEEGRFKGKHFITYNVDRDAREVAGREEYTDEEWKDLCEQRGGDPDSDHIVLSEGEATPGGVSVTPSHFLTTLIATYALTGLPLTAPGPFEKPLMPPLIEALHPDPESADMEKVYAKVDELTKVAGHLAVWVRGGILERGTSIEEVSREEHFAAWLIRDLEEEGVSSDEEIHERVRRTFPSFAWLTPEEIDRIRRERLEPPH